MAVAGVLMDVTVRRAAEEKLRFANNLLTTLRETSPDAILVIDADMRIISFNRQFRTMWLLPADLVEGASDAETLAAVAAMVVDPEAFLARTRYLDDHPEESAQEEIQTMDGRLIDRHTAALRGADGGYLGRVWFFRDITDRRKAERALAESEIRFRAILQATNDGIAVVDHDTRLFTLGNQALCKMLGYTLEELTSLDVGRIYLPRTGRRWNGARSV